MTSSTVRFALSLMLVWTIRISHRYFDRQQAWATLWTSV